MDPQAAKGDEPDETLLIRGAQIVDGTGAAAFAGDVRIAGGFIADVGRLDVRDGDIVFEARGLMLAPGFIDTHSHAERDLFDQPDALPAVTQGITTVVVGQDGVVKEVTEGGDAVDPTAAVNACPAPKEKS